MNFSVLMSIYKKEKPEYFSLCMKSLFEQSIIPTEIVIVKDGPLTEELDNIIDEYINKYPNILKTVPLEINQGLGKALAIGVENCSHELIARMDTDDICAPDRFEIQLKEFKNNPGLDILGSCIIEFENTPNNVLSKRNVPLEHNDIYNFARKRNPFNHMTVMYKKSKVLEAGNYQPPNGFEDYYLWARMLVNGCKAKNISKPLVYARTGLDMFERRGGYDYLKKSIEAKKLFHKIGLYSLGDLIISSSSHIMVSLMPNKLRSFIYLKLLRK